MPGTLTIADYTRESSEDGKSAAWYTAFFYLAEHVREATSGTVNHKSLYAFVGPKGRYINHSNPMVRKRTAGTLSRIVHTKRYAQDMRNAYLQDDLLFDKASEDMCEAVCAARRFNGIELGEWLIETCWPDIRRGLVNEAGEWRRELNLPRLDCEMSMLFASYRQACEDADDSGAAIREAEGLLAAMLYVMAFDHLQAEKARSLVDRGFSGYIARSEEPVFEDKPVYLIKFVDIRSTAFAGIWSVSKDAPFVIGRYTDCDAFELSEEVSRVHCRVFWEEGAWYLEDMGSRNGSKVHRASACVRVACTLGIANPFKLEFGDAIELPSGSTYLFAESAAQTW